MEDTLNNLPDSHLAIIDTLNATIKLLTDTTNKQDHQHILILIAIIIISGVFGGIANYFKQDSNVNFKWFNLVKSILLGLVAAAIVPLFLRMLQSQIMYSNDDGIYDVINYFVFTGFCLIAAYSSIQFLQSVSDKIVRDLEAVKKKTEKLEVETNENSELVGKIAEKETATEETTFESFQEENEFESTSKKLDGLTLLNRALSDEKYTFLTIAALSKASGLSLAEVEAIIADKIIAGEVKKFKGKDGKPIYALTKKGKKK